MYGGGDNPNFRFPQLGTPGHSTLPLSWSATHPGTPIRSQYPSPSSETPASGLLSLAAADSLSSLSSPALNTFNSPGLDNGHLQETMVPTLSIEHLHTRVNMIQRQLNSVTADLSTALPLLKTIADAIANPINSKAPIWFASAHASAMATARIGPKSAALAQHKTTFPNIKYWAASDYKPSRNSSTPAEKTSSNAGGTNRIKNINTACHYLEYESGAIIGGEELGNVRAKARHLLADLLQGGMLPRAWKRVGEQIRVALAHMLEKEYPYLQLCVDHWKVYRVLSDMYRNWVRGRVGLIGSDSDGSDSSDEDDDGKDHGKRKKKGKENQPRKKAHTESLAAKNPATDPTLITISQTGPTEPPPPPAVALDSEPPTVDPTESTDEPAAADREKDTTAEDIIGPVVDPPTVDPTESTDEPAAPNGEKEVETTAEDILGTVVVPPPPPPPPGSTQPPPPPPSKTTTTTKKVAKVANPAAPKPQVTTARNLYLAVYAEDVKGTVAEYKRHWDSLAAAQPALVQAYKDYSKQLDGTKSLPSVEDIRAAIAARLPTPPASSSS